MDKKNYKGYNAALVVGGALMVAATFYFTNIVNSALVAPTLIVTSLLLIFIGIALDRLNSLLRPAAKAFSYSGLAMVLLWQVAFADFGISQNHALPLSLFAFTAISFFLTTAFNDYVMAHVGYGAVFITIASLLGIGKDTAMSRSMVACFAALFACFISFMWYYRVKWLPKVFRHATRSFARLATPLVCFIACLPTCLSWFKDIEYLLPACVALGIALVQYLIGYTVDHSANKILGIRAIVQALVFFIVCTIFGMIDVPEEISSLAIGLTLLISSAIQVAISLFGKRPKNAETDGENLLTFCALTTMILSLTFFGSLAPEAQSVVRLVVYAIIGGFGFGLYARRKKPSWLLVPFFALLFVPLEFGLALAEPNWPLSAFIAAYAIVSLIYIGANFLLRKRGLAKEGFQLTSVSLAFSLLFMLGFAISNDTVVLGWLITTALLLAHILVANRRDLFEVPLYSGAICLNELCGEVLYSDAFGHDSSISILRTILGAHILAAAPIIAGMIKNSMTRVGVGYFLLSLVFYSAVLSGSSYSFGALLMFFFVLEQVIMMVLGIALKQRWLMISTIVFIALMILHLMFISGPAFITILLFILGFLLVVGVIVRIVLSSKNDDGDKSAKRD